MRPDKSAVILDRHPLWLAAVGDLLAGVGIEVVGRAAGSAEAITLVEAHRPDLLIASLDMAGAGEVDCVRRAKEIRPSLKVVVLADNSAPEDIQTAFAAGASVYCVKTGPREDLAVALGQAFERTFYLADDFERAAARTMRVVAETAAHELTRRELEILRHVAEGHSNGQLAKMLWVTEQTVKFHLSNIYRKLEVANRTEASRWAQLNGLLASPEEPTLEVVAA